ncbi:SNF2 family N-terminal domain-containing protein [Treponema berlinense]|uniref:SNF2 family N-terminal domain-containing protein n=1 Tax=Treponema berlinense TaxID=225004 RepID=A0A1T4KKW7_9SPIR|nr:SNF2-related protein [Treponema berlinense]SJZ43082.1 SNF2 family N-terminal domain-containing protein [Treponema berlinense]
MAKVEFNPGTLVKVRGREWVLESCDIEGCVKLRSLGGTDGDVQILMPSIEDTELESATFPLPDSTKPGSYSSALLLRNALRLKLTNAAGPFRSLGHVAVEPRSYQLVPLLMALKQNPVRLLIADDVGIGKTIEAGLIVKELLERGEVTKFIVLCPPHLVEQWVEELREHFNIEAASVTARSIKSLEKEVPATETFFDHYPASVISLDYIKADEHSQWFKNHAGDDAMIIVDEAHTCCVGGGRQLRFNLLKSLADDKKRNMLLLTATPHSGDENAFGNLISLLNPKFAELNSLEEAKDDIRKELAEHLVQRRRKDIVNYPGKTSFPERMVTEVTYKLTGKWGDFFEDVRKYCVKIAQDSEREKGYKGRMMWYATLALLRCISSSPAAARSALTTRLGNTEEQNEQNLDLLEQSINDTYDGIGDELNEDEQLMEPVLEESSELQKLIEKANALSGKDDDPKLLCLIKHIAEMYKERQKKGSVYRPVIFCKYIATAHYVAEELQKEFSTSAVSFVTGEYTSDQRQDIVTELAKNENPILVATDCLSEGINLQEGFNAVIHYDLAWNPTRHEQREGRVDRFGQQCSKVWCSMLYGSDNPVDGFIFNVILRKARTIKDNLGVLVPVPEDDASVRVAIVKAALMKERTSGADNEPSLFDGFSDEELGLAVKEVETKWNKLLEKEKANRTVFAQRAMHPEDVAPEWEKTKKALGDAKDVERFFTETSKRLNIGLEGQDDGAYVLNVPTLPVELRKQIAPIVKTNKAGLYKISFEYPPKQGYTFLQRSNPVVTNFASYLLEGALSPNAKSPAARCGTYLSDKVTELTTIYLLRIRYQIKTTGSKKILMAEESVALGIQGRSNPKVIADDDVEKLLDGKPTGNLAPEKISEAVNESIDYYNSNKNVFEKIAKERSEQLALDHTSVRKATNIDQKSVKVEACLPCDLIGVYVLLPDGDL